MTYHAVWPCRAGKVTHEARRGGCLHQWWITKANVYVCIASDQPKTAVKLPPRKLGSSERLVGGLASSWGCFNI